jgi:hypothetical protein
MRKLNWAADLNGVTEGLAIEKALDLTNSYLILWCTAYKICKLELKLIFRLKIKDIQALSPGLHTGS